jgi:hypothetical protein
MNEKGSALTLKDSTTPWNSNFSRLFLKTHGIRTQEHKLINS